MYVSAKSVYLFHPTGHYDLVGCTVKVPSESKSKKNKQGSTEPGTPKSKHGESTNSDARSRVSGLLLHAIFRFGKITDSALWMQNGRWINAHFLVSHFLVSYFIALMV